MSFVTIVWGGRTFTGKTYGEERKGKLVCIIAGSEWLVPKEALR